jgi:outer membrane receptor protein involved in Fe transport
VNHLARETNTQTTPFQSVGSWTTIDASLQYAPALRGLLAGMHINVAAINLFNRDPPRVVQPALFGLGYNFDPTNASPVGRFVRLQVSKEW